MFCFVDHIYTFGCLSWDKRYMVFPVWVWYITTHGSGHEGVAVLLLGFTIIWWQNQITRQPHLPNLALVQFLSLLLGLFHFHHFEFSDHFLLLCLLKSLKCVFFIFKHSLFTLGHVEIFLSFGLNKDTSVSIYIPFQIKFVSSACMGTEVKQIHC